MTNTKLSAFQEELFDAAKAWVAASYHWGTLPNKHDREGHIAGGKENEAQAKFLELLSRAVEAPKLLKGKALTNAKNTAAAKRIFG